MNDLEARITAQLLMAEEAMRRAARETCKCCKSYWEAKAKSHYTMADELREPTLNQTQEALL